MGRVMCGLRGTCSWQRDIWSSVTSDRTRCIIVHDHRQARYISARSLRTALLSAFPSLASPSILVCFP